MPQASTEASVSAAPQSSENGFDGFGGQPPPDPATGLSNGVQGMSLGGDGGMGDASLAGGRGGAGGQMQMRGGDMRPRGQNMQVFTVDGDTFARLHQTNIITVRANGDLTLSSGGWMTHQTLKGINTALKTFAPGLQVVSDGHVTEGVWHITNGQDWSMQFFDGVTVPGAAPQNLAAQVATVPGLYEQMVAASSGFEPPPPSTGYPGMPGAGPAPIAGPSGMAVPQAPMPPAGHMPGAPPPLPPGAHHMAGHGMPGGQHMGGYDYGMGRGGGKGAGRGGRGGGVGGAGGRGDKFRGGGWQDATPQVPPSPPASDVPTNMDAYDDIPVEASGEDCPHPVEQFVNLALHPHLQRNIELARYVRPTPVQRHAIPVGLARRDLMACAQTGSGKTGAFLFPCLHQIMTDMDANRYERTHGCTEPRCLVLSPTRELATQIHKEALRFVQRSQCHSVVVYGGADIKSQIHQLDKGCQVLVATPGRLVDLIERRKVRLTRVNHLVLDEADRMLDMGFEPQIRRVVEQEGMPPAGHRQTLMFSATFPKEIQRLASEFMTRYIFLAVGRVGSTTALITQSVHFCEDNDKRRVMLELVLANPGRTIIFVETKRAAEQLEEFLYRSQIAATSIHGDRSQREREFALASFRRGSIPVLVATDVAARGLDVPDCMHVINYELPRDINSYVHRIGRTGRMGKSGLASSLFSPANKPLARDMVTLLQEAQQVVPDWLLSFANASGHGGGNRYQGRGKFGGRDYRSNAQVRQYRHSSAGGMPGAPGGGYSPGGYGAGQSGGYGGGQSAGWQQGGGYMPQDKYAQPQMGMYGRGSGGMPAGGADGQTWAGYQMGGMPQHQMAPAAYQQQHAGGGRGGGGGGWMGMQGMQAAHYPQYYGQQAQGGVADNAAAGMMPMMWPQQQMPQGVAPPEPHYGQYNQ
jgi:ATP-dependent RNA helicase DDX3X